MVGGEAHHRGHREKLWLDPLQSCHVNNRTSSFQCQQWCSWFYLLIYGLQTSNLRPQTWRGERIQRIWWNTVSSPQKRDRHQSCLSRLDQNGDEALFQTHTQWKQWQYKHNLRPYGGCLSAEEKEEDAAVSPSQTTSLCFSLTL